MGSAPPPRSGRGGGGEVEPPSPPPAPPALPIIPTGFAPPWSGSSGLAVLTFAISACGAAEVSPQPTVVSAIAAK